MNVINSPLPHIYIPQIDANFLIDTGSSNSLINPELAYKYFNNFIREERFNIQTAHNRSLHNKIVEIPLFDIFNIRIKHKF